MAFCRTTRPSWPTTIMWSNNPRLFRAFVAGLLLLSGVATNAQTARQRDSTTARRDPYALVLTVGSGLSYYPKFVGVPPGGEQVSINRFRIPATVRLMWHPDHRLRIGLESGWVPMYGYRITVGGERARVGVSAVPMLVVFSMPLAWLSGTERSLARRLSVVGGTGAYVVRSSLAYGGAVDATRLSIGWMVAGAYTQPISRRFRVATELKWYNVTATSDAAFALQLQLVWRAFSW